MFTTYTETTIIFIMFTFWQNLTGYSDGESETQEADAVSGDREE